MDTIFLGRIPFKLKEKDKKLYDEYGKDAIEFAKRGQLLNAINLFDKILEEDPDVEFALVLKANNLFNHISLNLNFDDIGSVDVKVIKNRAENAKQQLQECINLIERALKINPINKEVEELKKFISGTPLKGIEEILKNIN